jgi:DEAD/DEAH box helicase domain-containing protein
VRAAGPALRTHGDVLVRSQVVGFKKIKFFTNENVGAGKLELPENEMHTTAYWLTLERALLASLPFTIAERQNGMFGLLHALESVATLLLMCDRRDLGIAIGERPPSAGVRGQGLGISEGEATVRKELGKAQRADAVSSLTPNPESLNPVEFFEPNLYLYDAYPGGIGFSEPLFRVHDLLVRKTRELISGCACENGCPSCVGPVYPEAREASRRAGDKGERTKEAALAILARLCE